MYKSIIAAFLLVVSATQLPGSARADAARESKASGQTLPELTPEDVPAPSPRLSDAVDFTELRTTFGKRADFQMRCELSRPTVKWSDAMKSNHFEEAYDVVLKWFAQCPVDERAHLWAIATLKELGDTKKIDDHKRWWFGLTDSVLKTGDGKSVQTAFVTISVSEEYAILTRLQLKRVNQSLVPGPIMVDKLDAEPIAGGGAQQSIYFNPYWHFVRLAHMQDSSNKRN